MSDIERLEVAIKEMGDQSRAGMEKLNESMTTLLIAQTAFYEHKETITRDVEKLEKSLDGFRGRIETKLDDLNSEISGINVMIGRGDVIDDINKHKLKNMIPWGISLILLAITIVKFYNV